jgi:integrase/recombinase XerD
MPPKGGNLYQREGVWWGRVSVNGRDVRRSLRTTSRAEAQRRLKAFLDQANRLRFGEEPRYTWKDAVIGWAETAEIKQSTRDRYLTSLRKVHPIMDGLYVDEIDRRAISRIARRPGPTNATRRRDLTAVSMVLAWCVAHGWREDNPARAFDRSVIRERRDPIELPNLADIDRVVAAATGGFGRLIRFAQYTGMRQDEIASLRWDQVRGRSVQLVHTKTRRPRAVPLDERALGTLAGTPRYLGGPFVFWWGEGKRYAHPETNFRDVRKRSGAAHFRFHDLRHLFAVEYLRGGGSIYVLQQILGHRSIVTTEIYLDFLTPEEAERAKAAK